MSVTASTHCCSNYTQRLPQAMLEAAGRSFLISFAGAAIVTLGNVPLAVAAGALASAASLIDSLVRPLIQPRGSHDRWCFNSILKTVIILTLNAACPLFKAYLPLSVFCTIIAVPEYLFSIPTQRNQAQSYCVFG